MSRVAPVLGSELCQRGSGEIYHHRLGAIWVRGSLCTEARGGDGESAGTSSDKHRADSAVPECIIAEPVDVLAA